MRGLKEYLASLGEEVSGSDLKITGHKKENITSDTDFVVRTSAVSPGSPGWVEIEEAKRLGIKTLKRSELLGQITKDKRLIAISGMHGKTTITSLVALLLIEAGLDPTVLVGEEVPELGGVLKIGKSDWFVAEACEYDRSFLDLKPEILILSNIEEEHLDTYPGGLPEIKEAFRQYLSQIKKDGVIIACQDDKNVVDLINESEVETRVVWYGFSSEKYNHLDFVLSLAGEHNRQNALAVVALADYLNISEEPLQKVFAGFKGAHRRFELLGEYKGVPVIDDYGHHPTEIKKTIEALAERYPNRRRVVVFWPHQYKRIQSLLPLFADAFRLADEVILKPIYFVPGRDEVLPVSSDNLAELLNQNKNLAKVMESDDKIIQYLKENLDSDSVLLTIGIPPVYKIANRLLENDGRN